MCSAPLPPSSPPHPHPKLTREPSWTCLVVGNSHDCLTSLCLPCSWTHHQRRGEESGKHQIKQLILILGCFTRPNYWVVSYVLVSSFCVVRTHRYLLIMDIHSVWIDRGSITSRYLRWSLVMLKLSNYLWNAATTSDLELCGFLLSSFLLALCLYSKLLQYY